ncbi:histidine kinase [Sphingobium sp. BYY-5]|uniref:sensor histidine kinase n=1 Tax=Sphingobium sp. BYY-5 TaxID=2926400 RepID=UPI001FA79060|nr:histidine kinase [Sphingobium sp. BYY-5]MCI4592308.1 histidine kinase [Sphingobium sp. BYY-5]
MPDAAAPRSLVRICMRTESWRGRRVNSTMRLNDDDAPLAAASDFSSRTSLAGRSTTTIWPRSIDTALHDRSTPPSPVRTGPTATHPLPLGGGIRVFRVKLAIVIVAVWTASGLFLSIPEFLNNGFNWAILASKMIDAWVWVLLTPPLLWIDRWLGPVEGNSLRLALVLLLLSIPVSLVHAALATLLSYPISAIWWNPLRSAGYLIYYFMGGWLTYCAFVGIWQAFKFYNRLLVSRLELERVERRLVEANLNTLRLQLEPHFLFNALNAISSEAATDPKLARQMIENLGTLLRHSMDCQESAEISLAQELALLDNYLAIQKVRFGHRIEVKVDAAPDVLSARVPSLLLQPLVENAIRHGIESRVTGGMIGVSAQRSDDQLEINVIDDGVGLPADWRMGISGGLGLRVTQERLAALYPETDARRFIVNRREGGGTEIAIRLPWNEPA